MTLLQLTQHVCQILSALLSVLFFLMMFAIPSLCMQTLLLLVMWTLIVLLVIAIHLTDVFCLFDAIPDWVQPGIRLFIFGEWTEVTVWTHYNLTSKLISPPWLLLEWLKQTKNKQMMVSQHYYSKINERCQNGEVATLIWRLLKWL